MVELTCLFCGKKYVARKDYSTYIMVKRKYCSRKCAIAAQRESRHWRDGTFCIKSNKTDGY